MDVGLPDGIYLDLDFPTYLAQRDRFGSTTKSSLAKRGEGHWWASEMNPYFKEKRKDYQVDGAAIHALLLEGMAAYESRFVVAPDKADYPNAIFTKDQIEARLMRAGVALRGTSGFAKKDWVDQALVHLPGTVIWDVVVEQFETTRRGRDVIDAETDFGIRALWDAAQDPAPHNAELRKLLSPGDDFPILAEVSILYTDADGIKHRARPDKFLPTFTTDLKSLRGWNGRPLVHAVDGLIKEHGYDVQLADYQIARRAGFAMILEDDAKLHGGTREQRAHVMAMARFDQTHKPRWAWIFVQKPDAGGSAPILFPVIEPWRGPYHTSGHRKRQRALALYRECMARFGPDRPWSRTEPVHHTTEAHQPHITQSHWGFDEYPVEGEDRFFDD